MVTAHLPPINSRFFFFLAGFLCFLTIVSVWDLKIPLLSLADLRLTDNRGVDP